MGRRIAFSRRALGAFVLLAGLTGLLDCAAQERGGEDAGASMAAASAATNDREAPPSFDTSLPLMQGMIERYTQDRALLERKYALPPSTVRAERFTAFFLAWLGRLDAISFDDLDQHGKVDSLLFRNHLDHELDRLVREQQRFAEAMEFAPFANAIITLDDDRRMLKPVDAPVAASYLADLARDIHDAQTALETRLDADKEQQAFPIKRTVVNRAAGTVRGIVHGPDDKPIANALVSLPFVAVIYDTKSVRDPMSFSRYQTLEMTALAVMFGIAIVLYLRARHRYKLPHGVLTSCCQRGYNLTGNTSGVCPECATKVDA